MNISLYNLSKNQITVLKGLSMILLVLHNYIHWTNHIGENEFYFNPDRIFSLFEAIRNDLLMIINGLISYFGFLAVEIFIFASAYGLSKQFMKKKPTSYWSYIIPRLIKIYGLIIVGLICYFLLLYPIGALTINDFISFSSASLLLSNNLSNNTIFYYPYIGPWWFFTLIVQLYVIFPFLFYIIDKYKKNGLLILMIVSYILIYSLLPFSKLYNIPFFAHFIGHLPEFILAIGFAMFKEFRINNKVLFVALSLFVLSNFYSSFFPLLFLCAIILILFLSYPIYNSSSAVVIKPLLSIGQISMFMFILNGPLRAYTIGNGMDKSSLESLVSGLLHVCLTILLSYILSVIYKKLVTPSLDKFVNYIKS